MIINHNMQAINAHRQMSSNATTTAKSTEKLSSGLRINRAGDDAAGLAISEKMRGQIRGLDQASRNSQDGISLIQTAEGALNETHSILQRMRELSVQSASETNTNDDRVELQKEIGQLTEEIDRIATTTEFNTMTLLKGDNKQNIEATGVDLSTKLAGTVTGKDATSQEVKTTVDLQTGVAKDATLDVDINGKKFTLTFGGAGGTAKAGDISNVTGNGATIELGGATLAVGDDKAVSEAAAKALQDLIDADDSLKGNFKVTASGTGAFSIEALKDGEYAGSKGNMKLTFTDTKIAAQANTGTSGALATLVTGTTVMGKNTDAIAFEKELDLSGLAAADVKDLAGKGMTIGGQQIEFYDANDGVYEGDAIGINISGLADGTALATSVANQLGTKLDDVTVSADDAGKVTFTSKTKGVNGDFEIVDGGVNKDFKVALQVGANSNQTMDVEIGDMRAKAIGVDKIDVSTKDNATEAIDSIDAATKIVSAQRASLGAVQNRLEHTINNLGTSSENLTAAESRIRDVDMAKEMMNLTKANVLSQASQAMLAQANQKPNQVLSLLQ